MSKKIAPNAFGFAFIVLSLSAFIVIFAACGGGGGDSGDDSSSSGLPGRSSEPPPPPPGVIEESNITALLGGLRDHELTVSCGVRTASSDYLIDKVEIVIKDNNNNRIIFEDVPTGTKRSSQISGRTYEFPGQDFCNDREFDVCANIYVDSSGTKKTYSLCKAPPKLKRNVNSCSPSSSSFSSSSVSPPKSFVPLLNGNTVRLNSKTGDRGIVLSTNTPTTDFGQADIYLDKPTLNSQEMFKTEKNNVNIISTFRKPGQNEAIVIWGPSGNDYGGITEPESTSQFVLNNSPGSKEVPYNSEQYYMVRVGSSGSEWVSGDYLVLAYTNSNVVGDNAYVDIKVWKIN